MAVLRPMMAIKVCAPTVAVLTAVSVGVMVLGVRSATADIIPST